MPFRPGETVDLIFRGHPDTTTFAFLGRTLTVLNGGLEAKQLGIVKAVIRLPTKPGKYAYEWIDGARAEAGHLRVTAPSRPSETTLAAPVDPGDGVPSRRFTYDIGQE